MLSKEEYLVCRCGAGKIICIDCMADSILELCERLEKAEAELDEARPFMAAVKSLHNGYSGDPNFKQPKSPMAAVKQLIGEAESLGLAESKLYKTELAELKEKYKDCLLSLDGFRRAYFHTGEEK